MVKFGKKLREKKIKQWEEDYIDYKALKQFIKKNNDPSKLNIYFYYYFFLFSKYTCLKKGIIS